MKIVEEKEEWKVFTTHEVIENILYEEEEFILYLMADVTLSILFSYIFK